MVECSPSPETLSIQFRYLPGQKGPITTLISCTPTPHDSPA
jgi:hypothetical protein